MLAKLPSHPTLWLQTYLGLGPAIGRTFGDALVAGSYFWLRHGFALLAHDADASGVAWSF